MRFHFLALALLCLGSCGGSGSKDRFLEQTLPLPALGLGSGFMTQVAGGGPSYLPSLGADIVVGDDANNDAVRGYLRFSLGPLPAGSQVINAVLRLNQANVLDSPYADLGGGPVRVDHIDMGLALDAADWSGSSLGLNIGTLSTDATLGPKSVVAAAQVALDLVSGRQTSDFRFLFANVTDVDATPDQAVFTKPGQFLQPILEVTVRFPAP